MGKCYSTYSRSFMKELITQLAPLFDYDNKRIEAMCSTKQLIVNDDDIKTGFAKLVNNKERKCLWCFAHMRGLFTAISNLVPEEFENEEDKAFGEDLKDCMDKLVLMFGVIVDKINERLKHGEDISWTYDYWFDLSVFVYLSFYLYISVYDLFYGSKNRDSHPKDILNTIKQMSAMLSTCQQSVEHLANETRQANCKIDIIKTQTEQTVKDSKHITDTLEGIQRNQKVSDDTIKRKSDKIIEKVEKRNKKESRCELTQMDCARIIAEERQKNYEAKKSLLDALRMSTETIDKDKNPDEENIARTIVRWDTGKTKPPVGYSRRISEYEFREWVKKREKKKLDNWIVKIRKSLKTVQAELVPEEVLDEWMRLNSGNDNDPYSKIKA